MQSQPQARTTTHKSRFEVDTNERSDSHKMVGSKHGDHYEQQQQQQMCFSSTQRVTGISKDIMNNDNFIQTQNQQYLRQSHNNIEPSSCKGSSQSSKPSRQSSAQPVNRLLQFNNNYNSNPDNQQTNYNQDSNKKKGRPSSGKRQPDRISAPSSGSDAYTSNQNAQKGLTTLTNYKNINSQQNHKRTGSNAPDQAAQSKFSQLVCQVPQNTDPKLMLAAMQNRKHDTEDSKTTTLESSYQQQQQQFEEEEEYLLGPQRRSDIGKKTLVLDLDETLVHSSFKPIDNPDIVLPVEIEGSICNIFILVRPGVSQFLKKMHKHYELVIFTASLSKYADPLVDILDPEKLCSYRLFREHCTFMNNAFVKDLTRLGRKMTDVIILDNSPIAYMLQPENAMPSISWYDDMNDRELARTGIILERLAYEDDVRRIIKRIITNNEIDPKAEQVYLHSKQRDHSQKVQERAGHHNTQDKGHQKRGNQRYESADNRQKHAAIINEQIKKRHKGVNSNDEDAYDPDNFELMVQQQNQMQQEQSRLMRTQLLNQQQERQRQLYEQQQKYQSSQMKPREYLRDSKETFQLGNTQEIKNERPATTKGSASQRNGFFQQNPKHSNNDISHSHSQNTTPISKRAVSVRQSQNQNQIKESQRKDRGHSASSAQRNKNSSVENSASRKKNTFTNFLSSTQKLSREDPQEKIQSIRGHSQVHTLSSNPQSQHISPRPSTVGHTAYHSQKSSSQNNRQHSANLGSSQRIASSNVNHYQMANNAPNNFNTQNQAPTSHHSKKNSSCTGTQVLKQSLKDLQDMLKITQNKLNKQQSFNQKQTSANDDASFLKKLSRQSEMQQNIMMSNQSQPQPQQQQQQYASRYSVNSPKYKENLNILNSNGQPQNPLQNSQGPSINQSSSSSNIILQSSQNFNSTSSKHQKRTSNPFQQEQPDSSLESDFRNKASNNYDTSKNQQIKLIHNINNNNQIRQSQVFKQQQLQQQQQTQQPLTSSTNKFINSYLNSVNATPTAAQAAQNLRSSMNKMFAPGTKPEEPAREISSKNFYNQLQYGKHQ